MNGDIGILVTNISATPEYKVGTVMWQTTSTGDKAYMYVKDSGSGITGAGYVVDIDVSAYTAVMSTTTTTAPGAGAGKPVGVATGAVTASYYCWVQIYGVCVVRVAASCAAYTLINSTATAGQLDDDATAGAEVINGLVLDVANGGSAGTVAAFAQFPNVGRTL